MIALLIIYAVIQTAYSAYYFRKAGILSKKTYTGKREIKNRKPLLKVYVAGDSIGAGVGASSYENSVFGKVYDYLSKEHSLIFENASVSGHKMADLLNLNPPQNQDLVILIISSNNVFRITPLDQFEKDTKEVLKMYSKVGKKIIIVGPARLWEASAIPIPARIFYRLIVGNYINKITSVAKNYQNVVHLTPINPPINLPNLGYSLAGDKFHPNDKGHAYWFEMIKTKL